MNSKKEIKLLVVEDHDSVSLGIFHFLNTWSELDCQVIIATEYHQALRLLKEKKIDLVLLDIYLSSATDGSHDYDGDALLREINKQPNPPFVIIYSKIDSLDMLDYLIYSLGAQGYILKSRQSLQELPLAIKAVLDGQTFFSPTIQKFLRFHIKQLDMDYKDRLILKGLSRGLTQPKIKAYIIEKGLACSLSSIEKRIKKMKNKFDAASLAELLTIVIRKGII